MKSKDDFVKRWRHQLAGLALYGVTSEVKDGPVSRAGKTLEIVGEVETLLNQMYDDLVPKEEPAPLPARPQTSGRTTTNEGATNGTQRHAQR